MRRLLVTLLLSLVLGGCSQDILIVGAGRVLSGTLEAEGGSPALSAAENAVLFMTRGGVFSSAAIDEDGNFAVQIPEFATTGALVVRRILVLPGGGQEIRVDAVLVDDAMNGAVRIAGGSESIELAEPLVLNLDDVKVVFGDAMDIPEEIVFLAAPYSKADLCAWLPGSPSANCALSELFECVDGDADAANTCARAAPAHGGVILACNPCADMGDPDDFEGPFAVGTIGIGTGSIVDAAPLPKIVAPFRGLAVTGMVLSVPSGSGANTPSVYLNLSARPDIFLTDPTDPAGYRFVFESGRRFSAEQLVLLTVPELAEGSNERVTITYRTTSGTLSTVLCACGDTGPQCRFLPGVCAP